MASLESRNGNLRIVFRLEGQKFARSLDTKSPKAANVQLAQLEHRLNQYEIGGLVIPSGCDPVEFLLNGSRKQQSSPVKTTYGSSVKIQPSWKLIKESLPLDSLEDTTLRGMATHVGHLSRLIGNTNIFKPPMPTII